MVGWAQRRALPTSLPGSPAAYDTGALIEPLGERLVERSETQRCQEVQQRKDDDEADQEDARESARTASRAPPA